MSLCPSGPNGRFSCPAQLTPLCAAPPIPLRKRHVASGSIGDTWIAGPTGLLRQPGSSLTLSRLRLGHVEKLVPPRRPSREPSHPCQDGVDSLGLITNIIDTTHLVHVNDEVAASPSACTSRGRVGAADCWRATQSAHARVVCGQPDDGLTLNRQRPARPQPSRAQGQRGRPTLPQVARPCSRARHARRVRASMLVESATRVWGWPCSSNRRRREKVAGDGPSARSQCRRRKPARGWGGRPSVTHRSTVDGCGWAGTSGCGEARRRRAGCGRRRRAASGSSATPRR
jgi:hypothetical protein